MGMDCVLCGHSENESNGQQSSGGYHCAKNNYREEICKEEAVK